MHINRWLLLLLLLPHFNIYYYQLPIVGDVVAVARVATLVIALAIILVKMTKMELLIITFFGVIITSSIINDNLTLGALYRLVVLFGLIVFLINQFKENFEEIINAMYYLLSLLIFLNLITVLIGGIGYTDTGSTIYLLGSKNHIIFTTLLYVLVIYIYSFNLKGFLTITYFSFIFISLLGVILAGSGTGILLAIITLVFILFPKKLYPSIYIYITVYISLFLSIIVYRIHELLLSSFIVEFLDKSTTFSGRTLIWDIVINAIKEKRIWGYGRGNTVISDVYYYLNEAHNGILQLLLDSGVIGLTLFALILLKVSKKLNAYKSHKLSKILSLGLFLFLLNSLSESIFLNREFWIMIIMAFSVETMIGEKVEIKGNYTNEKNYTK